MRTENREPIEARERPGVPNAGLAQAAPPVDTEAVDGLVFQRCRWCHAPDYRRSICRTCGSADLAWERSAGRGVIVRRNAPAASGTFLVAMDEGFGVVCEVADTPAMYVAPRARVRLLSTGGLLDNALPVVALVDPPSLRVWRWK